MVVMFGVPRIEIPLSSGPSSSKDVAVSYRRNRSTDLGLGGHTERVKCGWNVSRSCQMKIFGTLRMLLP